MNAHSFIINPMAGKGKGRKLMGKIRRAIADVFPDAEILITERKLHALELARERNADPGRVVVAVGGDGTVNEVGNGLIGGTAYLGVIPIGSGNDFVKMFSISGVIEDALFQIRRGTPKSSDAGLIRITGGEETNSERFFLNGIGIGFDAAVANQTTKFKHLSGFPLYIASVARTLMYYTTPNMLMSLNGAMVNGRHFLIAVGNGKCAGGGFYLTPEAKIDDGLLDVCLVDNVSVGRVLKIFPSVIKGKHEKHKEVHFYKTPELKVVSKEPIMVHADGEVLATKAREIVIKVKPAALQIVC